MVHALRTKDGIDSEFMAIKTDMSKTYDRVEWCFVEFLLERMSFEWMTWIISCISYVTCSVLLNGRQHGIIKPEGEIRQGDPLSPFLFILCAESLVSTLNQADVWEAEWLCTCQERARLFTTCFSPMIACYFVKQLQRKERK